MPARAAVHSLISTDVELGQLGVQAVYAANTIDTPGEDCFIVIRWETDVDVAFADKAPNRCSIWVHDTNPDYGRIDQVLKRVRELMLSTVHRAGDDGMTMTQADYTGDGPDAVDDGYRTFTRWSGFTVVSRYTTT